MKNIAHLGLIATALLVSPLVFGQTTHAVLSRTGTVKGIVDRTELDRGKLYSVWCKVGGRMHEFMIDGAKFIGGSNSDLQKGAAVQIKFKNREHSEMDDFFTANAITIKILKGINSSETK
ncbi:MAG TPA: hypothetical protein VE131_09645 [Terriglobales bacterium]|nr:hypothetical protein [Terriglobales bacterium]